MNLRQMSACLRPPHVPRPFPDFFFWGEGEGGVSV